MNVRVGCNVEERLEDVVTSTPPTSYVVHACIECKQCSQRISRRGYTRVAFTWPQYGCLLKATYKTP
jgi:hypothetical protein